MESLSNVSDRNRTARHSDEILYMDEISDDATQPLAPVHSNRRNSHSDSVTKPEDPPSPREAEESPITMSHANVSDSANLVHAEKLSTSVPIDEMHSETESSLHQPDFLDTETVPFVGLRSAFSEEDLSSPFIGPRAGALLETDNTHNPRPTSGPEIDDEDERNGKPRVFTDNRGIDDGLLPVPASPRYPGDRPFFPVSPMEPTPDVNVYQHKKTLAQGMMDLALLSANANQLRYVLQTDGGHPYYYPSLVMIGTSLFLQIAVGIGLIWNSRYNVKDDAQMCKANKANNLTVVGIFLVTILNVFISSFGVADQSVAVT